MPSYIITITNDEMTALKWKHVNPEAHLNDMAKQRCAEAMEEIYKTQIAEKMADAGFSGSLPKSPASLVESMVSAGTLKSAKQIMEESTERMLRMMANPDDVD